MANEHATYGVCGLTEREHPTLTFHLSFSLPRAATEVLAALLKSSKHPFKRGVISSHFCVFVKATLLFRGSILTCEEIESWVPCLLEKEENIVAVGKRVTLPPRGHVHV